MGGDIRCWEELANAIVMEVVRDYRSALKRLKKHPDDGYALKMKRSCEKFFLSQRFDLFTRIDGKALMESLRKEAE